MSVYTKQKVTMQYTEIVYYCDGEEIAAQRNHDDEAYDCEPLEPMTAEEIEDWT